VLREDAQLCHNITAHPSSDDDEGWNSIEGFLFWREGASNFPVTKETSQP
jgi:hypothetical protein